MAPAVKTKKPANTAFKQQRLKAWQPILTPKTVLPAFFAIGAIFVPLGIGLFIASNNVSQKIFDYSNCFTASITPTSFNVPEGVKSWAYNPNTNTCTITFNIDDDFKAPVFMYYRLTNFYQNHRRYVKSYDANQLKGDKILSASGLATSCSPLNAPSNFTYSDGTKLSADAQYYPCGLIANSMFTDTISNLTSTADNSVYPFSQTGIAWPSDSVKFQKTKWTESPADIKTNLVPPLRWQAAFPDLWKNGYNATNIPDIGSWEPFQVWMRTAGLPNFRKLYGRNDAGLLKKGEYRITIVNTFDVNSFGGTKSVVISTISIIGGKNPFLGLAYMTVGALCILLGVVFLARHMIKPRKLGDHTYLSWNQPAPQRAPHGSDGN